VNPRRGHCPAFHGTDFDGRQVNCLSTFSGPVIFEYNYGDRPLPYLPECLDFKNGKLYTTERPGLGVTLDLKQVN